jgi:hypothetical protein
LQQFQKIVSEDDLSRRGRDVLADPERVGRMPDRETTFASFKIGKEVVESLDEIFAVRLQRGAKNFGIGQDKIGRSDRVDELLSIEIDALACLGIDPFHFGDRLLHPIGRQKVGLLDEVEDLVFLPIFILEALVAERWSDDRFDPTAHHLARRDFPQPEEIPPQLKLRVDNGSGIGGHGLDERDEWPGQVQRIEWFVSGCGLAFKEVTQQFLRLLTDAHHVAGEFARVTDRVCTTRVVRRSYVVSFGAFVRIAKLLPHDCHRPVASNRYLARTSVGKLCASHYGHQLPQEFIALARSSAWNATSAPVYRGA